jgi:hypothetical protein
MALFFMLQKLALTSLMSIFIDFVDDNDKTNVCVVWMNELGNFLRAAIHAVENSNIAFCLMTTFGRSKRNANV